jgi:tape measure domain-containing protein
MSISTTFTLKFAGAAVERGLDRVQSAFKSLGGVAMKVGKSLLSPFAALTALIGTGALVSGLVSFIKGSSEAASSMEDLTMQFETLTKSASITKSLLDDFRKEAAKSPLSVDDYAQAGKLLLNFGTNVEDVMPRLKSLADVSMGNSDRFSGLALAFAQTTAKGRLMGQELNQMTERGFNPLKLISDKTGISMGALMKRMEKGEIDIKAVAEAFRIATSEGGNFYKAIEKGATTTSGKIAKTQDAIFGLKVAFGEGFNVGLTNALDRINEILPQMLGKFKEFGLETGKVMIQLMDAFEQGRLGEVIEAALMAGVTKAGEEMLAAMVFAGNALFDTIAERMEGSSLGKLFNAPGVLNNTPMFNKLTIGAKLSGPGAILRASEMGMALKSHFEKQQGTADTYQETRSGFRDAFGSSEFIQVLRDTLKQGTVPGNPAFRYAQPNESTVLRINGDRVIKMLDSLESIDKKLSPQP